MKQDAIDFIREYARTHFTFTGDQIFEAYRDAGNVPVHEDAGRTSRINWGTMIKATDKMGFHKVIGRTKPRASHSHVSTTCLRQSLIFEGEVPNDYDPDSEYLIYLWQQVAQKELKCKDAIKLAYQRGVDTGVHSENSDRL